MKELTRGNLMEEAILHQFINHLDITEALKIELRLITPWNYVGIHYKYAYT